MKKIVFLLAFVPSVAFAQGWQIGNPVGTPRALPTPGTVMNRANVDVYGNQLCSAVDPSSGLIQSTIPVSNASSLNGVGAGLVAGTRIGSDTAETSSTTTVINATSHVARIGDFIQFTAGTAGNISVWSPICSTTANTITLCKALPATPANGDTFQIGRPLFLGGSAGSSNSLPSLSINVDSNTQLSTATGILKLEDVAHSTGDAGVLPLAVRNEGATAFADTNGDYSPLGVNRAGASYVSLSSLVSADASPGKQPVRDEDSAFAASDAVMVAGGQAVSAITQLVGATGDVAPIAIDLGNRQIVTNAPAGETWQSCGTATATTADVAIKASVASNRIYVTSITCNNTSTTTGSNLDFKDGTTIIAKGSIGMFTAASNVSTFFTATFPTPLRGTSATALNFATNTSVSSVTCCAAGYISTI